ncbi:MAG: cold shock domain-containing protein [Anaerolineae bacterium]
MNFKDRWVTDENGEKILFTVEMQRQLSEQGLPVEPEHLSDIDTESTASSSHRESRQETRSQKREDFEMPETIQIDPQTGKYLGRMKWYNVRKGYGFIMRGGGEEIFFHKSNVVGDPAALNEGQWILYDVEETHKGPEAADIEPYTGETDLLS